ncbi:hypothetical protein GCM10025786_34710 [Nocardioides caeni]
MLMHQAQVAADQALEATVEACSAAGLIAAWRGLVQDVYSTNLDRYEPDELGDTPMTLGIQCSENLKTRAIRRFRHDELEADDDHWDIDGLRVWTPRNVLTFSSASARVVTMKLPFAEGRSPRWDRIGDWDQDSQIRRAIATESSRVLRYRSHAESDGLFPHTGSPGVVRNYMMLWAGEADAALTAGWLGVPVLGDTPFIARKLLWWDDEPHNRVTASTTPDRGPNFDERPAVTPEVTLKRRPQEGLA